MSLLINRLFNLIHPIRHSSRSREFFDTLKKLYRSTTSNLFMAANNRTCFIFDKDESTKILIQMIYEVPITQTRRKFNLLRSVDEPVSQTIRRLTANIERAVNKETKAFKRRKKQQNEDTSSAKQELAIHVQLLDNNNQQIDENVVNKQAWLNCKKLIINEQTFNVEYNAPAVIKFRFPEVIMTNTITTALVELDYGESEHSILDWYVTDELRTQENDENDDMNDDTQWIHVHRGPFCVFGDQHVNKFVRLACLPRNKDLREGMQAEHISKSRIIPCPIDLPMDTKHQLTQEYFPIDSNSFRLVSYNILANGYASSTYAEDVMYPYCPDDYLKDDYRNPLIVREILGYHADIIFLQECDTKFFQRELSLILKEHGYLGEMKIKSHSVQEGEAVFYRKDRFRVINTHDITISEYLRDAEHLASLRQRCSLAPKINTLLLERNTALQVVALEPQGKSNEIFLICNTHLYFHPHADVVRAFQALISVERIKEIKQFYENQDKNVSVIWSGDFNANTTSLAFQFIFTGVLVTDTNHRSYSQDYSALIKDFDYKSSVELSTYSNFAYTVYMPHFHAVIDHIFYDSKNFQFQRAIPMPTHEEVTEFTALPNCKLPSDHLAVVIELEKIE